MALPSTRMRDELRMLAPSPHRNTSEIQQNWMSQFPVILNSLTTADPNGSMAHEQYLDAVVLSAYDQLQLVAKNLSKITEGASRPLQFSSPGQHTSAWCLYVREWSKQSFTMAVKSP
jgi:hypothetical protein